MTVDISRLTRARKTISVQHRPAVSGDLFPWKVRVHIVDGPTILLYKASTEEQGQQIAQRLRRDIGAYTRILAQAA